MVLHPV
jgi:hypothetical protein